MSEFRTLFLFCFALSQGDIAFAQHVTLDTPLRSPDGNEISDVRVAANGDKVSVDVELWESVTPTLTFGENPDRLIADFPNVSPRPWLQQTIPVGRNGIERIRIGQNHSSPHTTRVVVDLDSVHSVTVVASDREVSLNILPALTKWARAETGTPNVRKEGNATRIVEVSPTTSVEPNLAADSLTTTGPGVSASDLDRSSEPSRLRWILPILTTSIILAMLVIALVSHIQNKRLRRGI